MDDAYYDFTGKLREFTVPKDPETNFADVLQAKLVQGSRGKVNSLKQNLTPLHQGFPSPFPNMPLAADNIIHGNKLLSIIRTILFFFLFFF